MAHCIMIQGTMSNAGKSFIAAALCRAFVQDGYKVAPFKSQNMALNSFITKDGFEIGRAQAMQAEAACIEPSKYMNPILLKPTTDVGSQVIVNGKAIGNMPAREYFKYKKKLIPDIMNAYNELSKQTDIIVIEGAGSPAEINLKSDDIVNMGLAKMLNAPVLLTGDIDRGGVFAQLYGTVMLLEKEERDLIKGIIINKFRGDKSILEPGFKMLEDRCNVPVIGALPYINVDIDDEDSLSERLEEKETKGLIDIAVIRLPKISNFTDLNSLNRIDGISVRYVQNRNEIKEPDLIVIPGSKNTIKDMIWLRESGIESRIKKLSAKGTIVMGICGGYQMLGIKISDPYNTEGGGEISAMGLLDIDTVFEPEKSQTQTEGVFEKTEGNFSFLSDLKADGYEIHMGRTVIDESSGTKSLNIKINGGTKTIGAYKNNILGSYLHGFFDSDEISSAVSNMLFSKKGLQANKASIPWKEYKDMQYDKMAQNLRENIDMNYIYRIMGLI